MKKKFLLFFVIFLSIYGSVHFYVLGRLFAWTGLPLDGTYVSWALGLTISFLAANLLEQKYSHWLTNSLYMIAATWMGMLGILLVAVVGGEIARFFLPGQVVVMLCIIFAAIFTIIGLVHAQRPVLRRYRRKAGVSLKIGLLTDIHLGPIHGTGYARRIVERFKKEGIGVLLLCGDIIDGPGELAENILTPFNALNKPIFMTWGNHEQYLGEENIARVLKPTKIRPVRNEEVKVKDVTIIGIDDSEDRLQVAKYLPRFTKKGFTILMYHRPDGLEDAAEHGIDLMVSGHTHNGQIFPFTLLVKTRFAHIKGWYQKKNTRLFVSTGAGTWGPPLRFGSRSEMVVIELHK